MFSKLFLILVLEPDTIVVIVEGDDVIHQKLHYNSEEQARSISITSPAHNDLQSLEIVMHAATNGYWHGHAQVKFIETKISLSIFNNLE